MPPLYQFRPEKRVGRLHRRGDRVRAWRQAAEAWKQASASWRERYERQRQINVALLQASSSRLLGSTACLFFGALLGAAVMAFVK